MSGRRKSTIISRPSWGLESIAPVIARQENGDAWFRVYYLSPYKSLIDKDRSNEGSVVPMFKTISSRRRPGSRSVWSDMTPFLKCFDIPFSQSPQEVYIFHISSF